MRRRNRFALYVGWMALETMVARGCEGAARELTRLAERSVERG